MRVLILAAMLLMASVDQGFTQTDFSSPPSSDSLQSKYKLDFGVPDSPAFQLVSVDQENILHPTSVKDITANFSLLNKNSFGIEFSPFLLTDGPTLTLGNYQAKNWIYNLRLSVAVQKGTDATTPTDIAIGLRDNFIDDTDFRTNSEKLKEIQDISDRRQSLKDKYKVGRKAKPILMSPDDKAALEKCETDLAAATDLVQYVKDHWNAQMLETAVASHFVTDPVDYHLAIQTTSFWLTYAVGMGNWGQILLGAKSNIDRTDGSNTSAGLNLGSRIYAGENKAKGFIEIGYKMQDAQSPSLLLNSGADINVFENFWAEISLGLDDVNTQSKVVSNINFKMGS